MDNNFKPNKVFSGNITAANVMGARPLIVNSKMDQKAEESLVQSSLLTNGESTRCFQTGSYDQMPCTINELIATRANASLHNFAEQTVEYFMGAVNDPNTRTQINSQAHRVLTGRGFSENEVKNLNTNDFSDAKINSSAQFLYNQITTQTGRLMLHRIRALSYHMLPMTNFGGGSLSYQDSALDNQGEFGDPSQVQTAGFNTMESLAMQADRKVETKALAIDININEIIVIYFGRELAGGNYNFVPAFKEIQNKFVGLYQKYMLALDDIAWRGGVGLAETQENDNTRFARLATDTSVSHISPILPNGKSKFSALSASEMFTYVGEVATNLVSNAAGAYRPNVIAMNLDSYLRMMTTVGDNQDTTAIRKLSSQGVIDLIYPVAALDIQYPDSTTIIAYDSDPQILSYNVALPLYTQGYFYGGNTQKNQYAFRTSGVVVNQSLGINAVQLPK